MRTFFDELLANRILWTAFFGFFIAQIVKVIIELVVYRKNFNLHRMLTGNGGMPSSHSSTVCALATMTAFEKGVGSFEFAFCIVFAIVVMTDASGVRRETGNQAVLLNELTDFIDKMFSPQLVRFSQDQLKELIGHTPLQVFVGAVLGVVIGIVSHLVWV